MGTVTINMLLEYLYKKFIVTFILCLIGVFIKISINTSKLKKIDAKKALACTIVASALMCLIIDIIDLSFSTYIVVSILMGIWSQPILKTIMNAKFMSKLLNNFLKSIKTPITKTLSDTLEDMEEDKKKKDKDDGNDSS